MKVVISCVLGLAFVALVGSSRHVRAFELADPTPEEKQRCMDRQMCLRGYSVKALELPAETQALGLFSSAAKMAIYKPQGAGPFPAVLFLHTCGPVDHQHMRYWLEETLARGYAAFVLDSWSQRGLPNGTCFGSLPKGFFPIAVRVRDAYDALNHLAKVDFVDASRVAAMGYSHGGRVAYYLASKAAAEMFSPSGRRFAAVVAVYGQCYTAMNNSSHVQPDIDTPLLSLLGELDEDGDPRECVPRLQAAKDKGAPVEWQVFPQTGHAWDQSRFSPPRRLHQTGSGSAGVLFAYDPKVADESRERASEFLARHLKRK